MGVPIPESKYYGDWAPAVQKRVNAIVCANPDRSDEELAAEAEVTVETIRSTRIDLGLPTKLPEWAAGVDWLNRCNHCIAEDNKKTPDYVSTVRGDAAKLLGDELVSKRVSFKRCGCAERREG